MRNATKDELEEYDAQGGIIIEDIGDGKWEDAGIEDGFLITSITNQPVKDINELRSILREASGYDIVIKGTYPSGKKGLYAMGW